MMMFFFALLFLVAIKYTQSTALRHTDAVATGGIGLGIALGITIFVVALLTYFQLFNDYAVAAGLSAAAIFLYVSARGLAHQTAEQSPTAGFKAAAFKKHWRSFFLLVLACVIYWPASTIMVGGQDPAFYSGAASLLARNGNFDVPLAAHDVLGEDENFKSLVWEGKKYRNEYNGAQLEIGKDNKHLLQYSFQRGPSYFMAVCMRVFGQEAGFVACSLQSIAAILVFYAFCTFFLSANWAFLAALSLLLCPAEIWFGKASYSEVPSQLFIFLALYALGVFLRPLERFAEIGKSKSELAALWTAVFSAVIAYLMRPDQVMVVGALIVVVPVFWVLSREKPQAALARRDWLTLISFMVLIVGLSSLAGYELMHVNPIFFIQGKSYLWFLPHAWWVLAVVGVVMLFATTLVVKRPFFTKFLNKCAQILASPITAQIVTLLILVFLFYGLAYRPTFEKLQYFGADANHNANARTMNEQIFIRLAVMVGPVNLILGFWGLYFLLCDPTRRRYVLVLSGLFAAYSAELLLDQRNSPMLYWASRRYLPILVPCFILFGYCMLESKLPRWISLRSCRVFIIGLVGLNFWPAFVWGQHVMFHREMLGSYGVISGLEKLSSPDKRYVIFSDTTARHFNFTFLFFSRFEVIQVKDLSQKLRQQHESFQEIFKKLRDSDIQPLVVLVDSGNTPQDLSAWDSFTGDVHHIEARFVRMKELMEVFPEKVRKVDHSYTVKVINPS